MASNPEVIPFDPKVIDLLTELRLLAEASNDWHDSASRERLRRGIAYAASAVLYPRLFSDGAPAGEILE